MALLKYFPWWQKLRRRCNFFFFMLTLQPWTDTRVESHPLFVFVEVNLDATHRKSMSLSLFTLPITRQPVVQPVAWVWPTSRMFDILGVENATKEIMIMKWKNKLGIKVQKKSCLRRQCCYVNTWPPSSWVSPLVWFPLKPTVYRLVTKVVFQLSFWGHPWKF